jgi:hypothetical protein
MKLIAKVSNGHLPHPPRPRSLASRREAGQAAKRGGQGRETHPYTPLKRGFTLAPGGLWLGANGSKRSRARVRG